jgi:lipopolysaccharide export system protein LptA
MKNILIALLFFISVQLVAQQNGRDTLSQNTVSRDTLSQNVSSQDTLSQATPQKKKIRILNSDISKSIESDTGTISRFRYNVKIEHEGVIMECDSAVLWPNGIFEAYENAKVTSGTTVVTGDAMIYSEITGKVNVKGRVVYLTDGGSTLRTTEVDFDTESEIGYFEHEGTIVDSFRTLESQKGYYYSKIKEFEFIGRVQSDTKDYVLQSDSMKYNTDTKTFTFYSHTHIWSENGYLYCDRGWYDSDKDIMFFHRNSYMLSPKQEVFADSIYYENKGRKGRLYSNIQVVDTVQKTIALADFADFDITVEDFLMRRNPSIIMYDDKDSVFLRADTLYSVTTTGKIPVPKKDSLSSTPDTLATNFVVSDTSITVSAQDSVLSKTTHLASDTVEYVDTTYKELFAFGDAKLYRKDFQLICDSMYFNNLDSIWKTYYNPVLWDSKKMQITSDSMKFYMKNGAMESADFNGNAMVVVPEGDPDSTAYFNQVKSKNMKAHLKDRQLILFEAMGNAQTIAFSLSDFTMNRTEADLFKVFFESGKARRVGYYGEISGNNNPLFIVREDEIKLPGYRWEINLRPSSGRDILNRKLRPSERNVREALPKPDFPITKRIDEMELRVKN